MPSEPLNAPTVAGCLRCRVAAAAGMLLVSTIQATPAVLSSCPSPVLTGARSRDAFGGPVNRSSFGSDRRTAAIYLIVIEAVDEYVILDNPVLVQPAPLLGAYMSLVFSCSPLNRPLVTVPVSACVVTGFPGISVSLNAMTDTMPLLQAIISVPLIGAVGGRPSVLQFSGALRALTNLTEPVLTVPEQPATEPVALSTDLTFDELVSFGSVGLNIPVPAIDLQVVPPAAPAGAAPITPNVAAIATAIHIPTTLRIVNAPLVG